MYYVYFLQSTINNDLYIGSTEDVESRFELHNLGHVKSTKGYRPWKLLEQKEYNTRSEAVRMERFYKSHQQREIIKSKYGLVAK